MILKELVERINFWRKEDRLGPDMPLTHLSLYFPSLMRKVCQKKFKGFGERSEFRPGAYALGCSKIVIGNGVIIRPGTVLNADTRPGGAGIVIEDDVLLGPGVMCFCQNHKFDDPTKNIIDQGYTDSKQITFKQSCWVGAQSIILAGITIGKNAVVGAGSVVTKDVPDRTVVVGNPARIIRTISPYENGS